MIDSYRLLESRDYGGTLMLTLEAPDSLGLLGSLLTRLALLGLVPVELHIETKAGRAYDSLWLGATGGGPPSDDARDAVAQVLDRSCFCLIASLVATSRNGRAAADWHAPNRDSDSGLCHARLIGEAVRLRVRRQLPLDEGRSGRTCRA